MRILVVSDEESKYIWDFFDKERFRGVELIISCGDLDPRYLTFLATMIPAPLVYVRGNHDKKYDVKPPEGCFPLDGRVFVHKGVRIMGFDGIPGMRGPEHMQYTEREMMRRIRKTRFQVWKHRGVDILVTHAPVFGMGDLPDRFHQGFDCFRWLLDRLQPRYHFYGHVHLRYGAKGEPIQYGRTTLINCCGYKIMDIEVDDDADSEGNTAGRRGIRPGKGPVRGGVSRKRTPRLRPTGDRHHRPR